MVFSYLYSMDELNRGLDAFRSWFNTYVNADLTLGNDHFVIEGDALNALQSKMDEEFAILVSELNGTPIVKLVCSNHTNYAIRLR